MNHQVPNIHSDLQESKEVLEDLGETLPIVQTQVHEIHDMYESGRRKVRSLDSYLTCPAGLTRVVPGSSPRERP